MVTTRPTESQRYRENGLFRIPSYILLPSVLRIVIYCTFYLLPSYEGTSYLRSVDYLLTSFVRSSLKYILVPPTVNPVNTNELRRLINCWSMMVSFAPSYEGTFVVRKCYKHGLASARSSGYEIHHQMIHA